MALRLSTIAKLKEYSDMLLDIIIAMNKKDGIDVKFSEIFIDINNSLNDIYTTGEYKSYSISILLMNMEQSLANLKKKLECRDANIFEVIDECISFKFLHYDILNMFPDGTCADNYTLDDVAAEKWWTSNFTDLIFIPNENFLTILLKRFPIVVDNDSLLKALCFKRTASPLDFISKGNFNLFLRFYGGWDRWLDIWPKINCHPAYMYLSTSEHAEHELQEIIKKLTPYRSPEKSYIFCLNWRCDSGLWNVINVESGKLINRLTASALLLQVLANDKLYLYPNGKEIPNAIPRHEYEEVFDTIDLNYDRFKSFPDYITMAPLPNQIPEDSNILNLDSSSEYLSMHPCRTRVPDNSEMLTPTVIERQDSVNTVKNFNSNSDFMPFRAQIPDYSETLTPQIIDGQDSKSIFQSLFQPPTDN